MSFRVPLILSIITLGLLAYILAFERSGPSEADLLSRQGFILDNVIREDIDRIRIGSGPDQVIARREGEGFDQRWVLEAPTEGPAADTVLDHFIGSWMYAAPLRTIQILGPEDIEHFGFDEPKASVGFEMDTTRVDVFLGTGKPSVGAGYVRIDDRPEVMVVDEQVVSYFTTDPEDWIGDENTEPTLDDIAPRVETDEPAAP